MKLVSYVHNNAVSCGILTDKGIIDIPSNWKKSNPPKSVMHVLLDGEKYLKKLAEMAKKADNFIPVHSIRLLAPIQRPGKLLALAGNYGKHLQEAAKIHGFNFGPADSKRNTTVPRPFIKPSTSIIGPGDEIPWPVYSREIDYEIELAAVIGKKAKCVPIDEALSYVGGYTIVNDVSARSVSFSTGRKQRPKDDFFDWLNGKWADGLCPMGPYLLTADEVDDVQKLKLKLSVNGEIRQDSTTGQMIYPVADIVSFLSYLMTLEPGDIIATGTPEGVGFATGNFLKAGDQIEATIEKLGTLTNTLGPQPEEFYEPLK